MVALIYTCLILCQGEKMNVVEMMKIQQEQQAILEEMNKGVVYIFGESEVVARPHS